MLEVGGFKILIDGCIRQSSYFYECNHIHPKEVIVRTSSHPQHSTACSSSQLKLEQVLWECRQRRPQPEVRQDENQTFCKSLFKLRRIVASDFYGEANLNLPDHCGESHWG